MIIRHLYSTELDLVLIALVKFAEKVNSRPEHYAFAKGFSITAGFENLKAAQAQQKALRIGDFAIFFDVVTPWYGGRPILQEWFTIRIEDTGMALEQAFHELQATAPHMGCRGILGGDSSGTGLAAKAYEANGFTPLTKQYFKEV